MSTEAEHRLPRSVVPRRYDLTLEPNLDTFTFRGSESILVDVVEATHEVVLNAVELDVREAVLVDAAGGVVAFGNVGYHPAAERIAIAFADPIPLGEHRLLLEFTGVLSDRLRGFYRATYTDVEGRDRFLATTQFEATDARRAFPCWDEPDLKAVFGVTLVVPDAMVGVSCGPAVREELREDGARLVTFGDTMPLSTYLLAFIVGDLEATDPVDVDGTPLRVVHTPGKSDLAAFALEAGAFALRFFVDYFGIDYPGDKLDMIAIPDFSAGAMENLGAITYRESVLLVDPKQATQAELERVAAVIGHEIAHMWFGNLVTMRWWNGTWLKEAFATFMELKCTDAFRPEWKTWLAFGSSRDAAMEIDALTTTRSIEFPVHSPEDANAMFDTITYEKGSAVLRMFEQYLGEATFQRGVSAYLRRHAHSNTEASDLWQALEAASGEPVQAIAGDWVLQSGFPQVQVDPADGGIRLRHECFRYLGSAPQEWKVPLRYRTGTEVGRTLLEHEAVVIADAPVIVNAGGSGFYRTRYAPDLLDEILAHLGDLDAGERFALVADMWANVLAGHVGAADFLALVARLEHETEPAVWQVALGGLEELDRIASPVDRVHLERLVHRSLSALSAQLGWKPSPDDDALTLQLRGLVLRSMGTLAGDQDTIREARAVLEGWFEAPEAVDGDVAAAALHVVAGNGGRAEFERFLAARASVERPQDGVRLLRAAASVPNQETALELLDMVLDGRVRRQDAYWVVARLLGQRHAGAAVWTAVKQRWDEVVDAMPPQNARLMLHLIHHRSEPGVADDILQWLAGHSIVGSEQLVAQQVERLAVRVAFRKREAGRLSDALAP